VSGDEEPFRIAGPITQFIGFGGNFRRQLIVANITVHAAQVGVCLSKFGIQLDGAFQEWNGTKGTARILYLHSCAVGFESLKRWCRGLLKRFGMFLYRFEGFARLSPELTCHAGQRMEHVFFFRNLNLLFVKEPP
jgi:hypothetical protein